MIAKIDIEYAYRLIPVRPVDRKWLGVQWDGAVYVDAALPFGLRSAPKIFNAVADGLEWCAAKEGIEHIFHYLDNFDVLGLPHSAVCQKNLDTLVRVCKELQVPLAPEKKEGPSTVNVFLGIIIDTMRQELKLPKEKLDRLQALVTEWIRKKSCTRENSNP